MVNEKQMKSEWSKKKLISNEKWMDFIFIRALNWLARFAKNIYLFFAVVANRSSKLFHKQTHLVNFKTYLVKFSVFLKPLAEYIFQDWVKMTLWYWYDRVDNWNTSCHSGIRDILGQHLVWQLLWRQLHWRLHRTRYLYIQTNWEVTVGVIDAIYTCTCTGIMRIKSEFIEFQIRRY